MDRVWGERLVVLFFHAGASRGSGQRELVRREHSSVATATKKTMTLPFWVIRYGFRNIPVLAPGEIRVQVRMIPDLLPDSLNSRNFLDNFKNVKVTLVGEVE